MNNAEKCADMIHMFEPYFVLISKKYTAQKLSLHVFILQRSYNYTYSAVPFPAHASKFQPQLEMRLQSCVSRLLRFKCGILVRIFCKVF
jgi:hypothetical protein